MRKYIEQILVLFILVCPTKCPNCIGD